MKKTIEIDIPEGFDVSFNKETLTLNLIPLNQEKKFSDLGKISGFFIANTCEIHYHRGFAKDRNRNLFPTLEYAKAALALSQLLQFRQRVIKDWSPDYTNGSIPKNVFCVINDKIEIITTLTYQHSLSFQTESQAEQFLKNHKSLLELAKPLL